jgi:hypothetical protein
LRGGRAGGRGVAGWEGRGRAGAVLCGRGPPPPPLLWLRADASASVSACLCGAGAVASGRGPPAGAALCAAPVWPRPCGRSHTPPRQHGPSPDVSAPSGSASAPSAPSARVSVRCGSTTNTRVCVCVCVCVCVSIFISVCRGSGCPPPPPPLPSPWSQRVCVRCRRGSVWPSRLPAPQPYSRACHGPLRGGVKRAWVCTRRQGPMEIRPAALRIR